MNNRQASSVSFLTPDTRDQSCCQGVGGELACGACRADTGRWPARPRSGGQRGYGAGEVQDVPVNTATVGGSGLLYDPDSDQYNYVWKTSKSSAGTCQTFTLALTDGTSHTATFQYK
jgi:hypothetical protein